MFEDNTGVEDAVVEPTGLEESTATDSTTEEPVVEEPGQEGQDETIESLKKKLEDSEEKRLAAERGTSTLGNKLGRLERTIEKMQKTSTGGQMAAQIEYQTKLNELNLQQQAGTADPSVVGSKIQALQSEYAQKVQNLQYQGYAGEVLDKIDSVLEKAGVTDKEVKPFMDKVTGAVSQGQVLDSFILEAMDIALEKAKAPQIDEKQIREDERKKAHEERKKTGMKVDPGTALGSSSSIEEKESKLGDPSRGASLAEIEEMRKVYEKTLGIKF
jgi:hypothetical protein